jgi:hypothetical protein
MKNYTKFYKIKSTVKKFIILLGSIFVCHILIAQGYGTIDIGIFEAPTPPNKIEVKLRPDFQIDPIETISGILYTLRWEDPTISLLMDYIPPYFIAPQGGPELYNGYYYQVFAAVPFSPVGLTINPGDEILISSFSFTGGACSYFEIIEDDWTVANNGGVYLEFLGDEVTGIIYEPIAQLGSVGGNVSADATITIGESTGILTLTEYSGTILNWQKRFNGGSWEDIPGTTGLTSYSEIPSLAGVWEYRAVIQRGTCPIVYSEPAVITVIGSSHWTGNIDDDWFNPGNWTHGVPNPDKDAIVPDVNPNPFPVIVGDAHCKGADIAAEASITIQTSGFLTSHGTFNNYGSFTIKSSPTDDGSFIDNGTITGNGTNRVERYIEEEMWHYVSPPIADGVSNIYYDIYLKEFYEESGTWFYIVPVDIPLTPMQGYAAYATTALTGSKTVYYDGSLNTGNYSMNLTRHPAATHEHKGFNFIGNPYPSAIDWDDPSGWTKTNVDNAIYFWNPLLGSYGEYVSYPPTGINGATNIIPSGQGIFIHVNNSYTSGSISVNNNARLHNDKQFLKETSKIFDYPLLRLKTYCEINPYSDETVIQFFETATPNFDPESDAYKMMGLNEAPQLYTITSDSANLAINTYPELKANISIPLGFSVGINGIYNIEATAILNFNSATELKLEDKKENILINLNDQAIYTFVADPLDDSNRFIVHFLPNPSAINPDIINQNIFIFTDGKEIFIKHSEGGLLCGDVLIHDLLGRLIYSKNISVFDIYYINIPDKGIYIVSFIDEIANNTYRKEVFLK